MTSFRWRGFNVIAGVDRDPYIAIIDGFLRRVIRPRRGFA